MRRSPFLARLAAVVFAALSLAACGGTVDFTIEKDLTVNSAVNAGATRADFDLAAEAGGAWKHRDKIDKVNVTSAEASVTAVLPGNAAAAVGGDVWLLPEGATTPAAPGSVKVGSYVNEPVQVGNVIALTLSPELDAFVEQAFNGSGKFSVYATGAGSGGAVVNCTLHVVLGAKLKWKAF